MPRTMMKSVILALQLAGEPGRRKLSGILDYVAERKCKWNIRFVRHKEVLSPDFVRRLADHRIDGIIYSLDSTNPAEMELSKLDIPTVIIDLYGPSPLRNRTKNIAFVEGDCVATARTAADFLLDTGKFRSFAFVPDGRNRVWGRIRGHAFIEHLRKHGFATAVYRRPRGIQYDDDELAAWLKAQPKPCGVFAAFDDRALDVIDACRAIGLDVPHDIAVVGVDNDVVLCEHTMPALTSVQPDHLVEGHLAAEMLDDMMASGKSRKVRHEVCSNVQTVARESTPAVSNAGRLVQRAVAYIQANATRGIGVRDVVAHLGCSRRLADLRFGELQGMSILDAIRKAQMDEVCHLLRTTNLSISAIAARAGFKNAKRLPEQFKAMFGCSCGAYRKQVQV